MFMIIRFKQEIPTIEPFHFHLCYPFVQTKEKFSDPYYLEKIIGLSQARLAKYSIKLAKKYSVPTSEGIQISTHLQNYNYAGNITSRFIQLSCKCHQHYEPMKEQLTLNKSAYSLMGSWQQCITQLYIPSYMV